MERGPQDVDAGVLLLLPGEGGRDGRPERQGPEPMDAGNVQLDFGLWFERAVQVDRSRDLRIGHELPVRGVVLVPVLVQEDQRVRDGVRAIAVRLDTHELLVVPRDDDHGWLRRRGAHAAAR